MWAEGTSLKTQAFPTSTSLTSLCDFCSIPFVFLYSIHLIATWTWRQGLGHSGGGGDCCCAQVARKDRRPSSLVSQKQAMCTRAQSNVYSRVQSNVQGLNCRLYTFNESSLHRILRGPKDCRLYWQLKTPIRFFKKQQQQKMVLITQCSIYFRGHLENTERYSAQEPFFKKSKDGSLPNDSSKLGLGNTQTEDLISLDITVS